MVDSFGFTGSASWDSKTLAGYQGFPKAGLHDDEPEGIWDLHLGQWKHGVVVGYRIRFFGRRVFVGYAIRLSSTVVFNFGDL